jgi:hypothetical protein
VHSKERFFSKKFRKLSDANEKTTGFLISRETVS